MKPPANWLQLQSNLTMSKSMYMFSFTLLNLQNDKFCCIVYSQYKHGMLVSNHCPKPYSSKKDNPLCVHPTLNIICEKPVLVLVQVHSSSGFKTRLSFIPSSSSGSRTESKIQTVSNSDFTNQTKTTDSNLPNTTQNWFELRIINSNSC